MTTATAERDRVLNKVDRFYRDRVSEIVSHMLEGGNGDTRIRNIRVGQDFPLSGMICFVETTARRIEEPRNGKSRKAVR